MRLLFSFDGRIRRSTFWLGTLGAGVFLGVVGGAVTAVTIMMSQGGGGGSTTVGLVASLVFFVVMFVAFWVGFALQIKRWHDRDKPWIWVGISLIPIVGPLWSLIECGFLDGTPGPNQFGPSPKGVAGPVTAPTV